MKPITEQRRHELIALANIELTEWDLNSDHYKLVEIALASLTAQPVGYTWDRGINCEIPAADLNDDAPLGVDLYAAPPVPVIEMGDDRSRYNESDYDDGFANGWNARGHEIKHLNGLGE